MTKLFGWRYVEDRDTLCLTLAEGWRDEFSSLRELLKAYGWTWDRRRREWHLVEASNHDDLPHHMKDIGFELDIIPGNMANAWELKWREILEPVRKIRQKLAAAKKAESQPHLELITQDVDGDTVSIYVNGLTAKAVWRRGDVIQKTFTRSSLVTLNKWLESINIIHVGSAVRVLFGSNVPKIIFRTEKLTYGIAVKLENGKPRATYSITRNGVKGRVLSHGSFDFDEEASQVLTALLEKYREEDLPTEDTELRQALDEMANFVHKNCQVFDTVYSQMKGQTDMPTPFIFSKEEEEPEQSRQPVKVSSGPKPQIKRADLTTKVIKNHEVVHWEIEADDSTLNGIVRTLRDTENATLWATRLPEAIHLAGQFQSTQAKIEVLCGLLTVPAPREIKQKIQDELIATQLELVVNQKEEEKKMPIIDTTDEGSPLSGLRDLADQQPMNVPHLQAIKRRDLHWDEDETISTKEMKEGLKQTAAEKRQILAERKELLARMKKKNDALAQQILEEGKQALAEVNEVAEKRVQRLEAKERRLRKMRRKSKSEMAVQTLTVSSILSLILLWIYGALRGRKPPVLAIEHEMEGKSVLALPAPKEEPVTVSEALGESAPPEVPFVAPAKPKRAPKAKAKAKKDA